ncbi:hypothetical protein G7Y79_00016g040400 [Physcia stellaris]|nr:hypothetical protein G7Y79_00016g040400 [Physcia stellaris]
MYPRYKNDEVARKLMKEARRRTRNDDEEHEADDEDNHDSEDPENEWIFVGRGCFSRVVLDEAQKAKTVRSLITAHRGLRDILQLAQSYFGRLVGNQYSYYMLYIQQRATIGLMDFVNQMFYKDKPIDGPATVLANRLISQAFLEWMKAHYYINTRYNVNNIVVVSISLTWTENSLTGELSSFTMEVPDCNSSEDKVCSQHNF